MSNAGQLSTDTGRFVSVRNISSQIIPAHGLCRMVGFDEDGTIQVGLPLYDGITDVIPNGPSPIQIGQYGQCIVGWPAVVAVAPQGGDPQVGEIWGVKANQYLADRDRTGLLIVAQTDLPNYVVVTKMSTQFMNVVQVTSSTPDPGCGLYPGIETWYDSNTNGFPTQLNVWVKDANSIGLQQNYYYTCMRTGYTFGRPVYVATMSGSGSSGGNVSCCPEPQRSISYALPCGSGGSGGDPIYCNLFFNCSGQLYYQYQLLGGGYTSVYLNQANLNYWLSVCGITANQQPVVTVPTGCTGITYDLLCLCPGQVINLELLLTITGTSGNFAGVSGTCIAVGQFNFDDSGWLEWYVNCEIDGVTISGWFSACCYADPPGLYFNGVITTANGGDPPYSCGCSCNFFGCPTADDLIAQEVTDFTCTPTAENIAFTSPCGDIGIVITPAPPIPPSPPGPPGPPVPPSPPPPPGICCGYTPGTNPATFTAVLTGGSQAGTYTLLGGPLAPGTTSTLLGSTANGTTSPNGQFIYIFIGCGTESGNYNIQYENPFGVTTIATETVLCSPLHITFFFTEPGTGAPLQLSVTTP